MSCDSNKFYHFLMQIDWLNLKDRYAITQAGVHICFCFMLMSIITGLLCINKWIACGYILPIIYPIIKEFLIDGHKLFGETWEEVTDLRTDLITNYLGILLGIPFAILNLLW